MSKWPTIAVRTGLEGGIVPAIFQALFSERGYTECRTDHWPCSAKGLDDVPGLLLRDYSCDNDQALVEFGEGDAAALIRLGLWSGTARCSVAAFSAQATAAALAFARDHVPRSEIGDDLEVPVSFWTYSPHGPRQYIRNVSVSPWDAISGNYTAPVRDQLRSAMSDFRPAFGGQLMLWTGEPGTGKTWALRALAWEWREWSSFHYVVDPDKFFGEHADYLIDVLLEGQTPHDDERERWRVLVLEDSGELLSADAKERIGQGLSRLLNVVDGVIGQGLRVLVLVTSNEEVKRLHPAVSRPGRCAMRVEFRALTAEEAAAWLRERDIHEQPGTRTLADLYALANGYLHEETERQVGFAAVG